MNIPNIWKNKSHVPVTTNQISIDYHRCDRGPSGSILSAPRRHIPDHPWRRMEGLEPGNGHDSGDITGEYTGVIGLLDGSSHLVSRL